MYLDPKILGESISKRPFIWQRSFLKADQFVRLAREKGLTVTNDAVLRLWQLGLLRADYVLSQKPLTKKGFRAIEEETQENFWEPCYLDLRKPRRRKRGWTSTLGRTSKPARDVTPYFHPYRLFILDQLVRVTDTNIGPLQTLWSIEGYHGLICKLGERFAKWSSSPDFLNLLGKWNSITDLAVFTEPGYIQRISGRFTYPAFIDEKTARKEVGEHRTEVKSVCGGIGLEKVEEYRDSILMECARLDDNRNIRVLLRLGKSDLREKLKGPLGRAMLFSEMAELLRRAAEDVFGTELPEEDEWSFGRQAAVLKKRFYGNARLIDSNETVKNEYLRQFRLDFGPRLRWYVEGDTEFGAIRSVFAGPSHVEVINLRGRVVEKNIIGFRDSLRNDLEAGVFSLVSIDGDRSDYVRAVAKAAEADEICGQFFVSKPDFEFANFELDELEEVLWEIAIEKKAEQKERSRLHKGLAGVTDSKSLEKAARKSLPKRLGHFKKDQEWGVKLMDYAWRLPETSDGKERPIITAVMLAIRAKDYNYKRTRDRFRVNPATGELIELEKQEEDSSG